ncbi:hypothetical protein ACFYUR_18575 [Micromonospora haikouensis]|uniref:hypothetical protein n=1 Tax=Micromonospora haikouensis TaxID=686309 RepID=UPI0036C15583
MGVTDTTERTPCESCGKPSTTADGIVGAHLCDDYTCLLAAYDRAQGEPVTETQPTDTTIPARFASKLPPYSGSRHRYTTAFNALTRALSEVNRFVALTERGHVTTAVLNALDADGGGTTTVEADINWVDDRAAPGRGVNGISYSWPADEFDTRLAREVSAARRLHRVPLDGRRRTVTEYRDGSTLTGPWTEFEVQQ